MREIISRVMMNAILMFKLIGAKPGFYFLHITTPKGVSTSKIILKIIFTFATKF